MLSMRQIEALVLVYRLGSLTKAAGELRVTQSAVSLLIRQMEDDFSLVLFDRTTRALRPTEACHEAINFAERILADARGLQRHMQNIKNVQAGHLTIAVSAGVAFVLPRVVARYMKAYPNVAVNLIDVDPNDLVACIKAGEAEFGIGNVGTLNEIELEMRELLHSPLSAITLRSDTLASRRRVAWDDLRHRKLIAMRRGTRIRTQIEDALMRAGKTFAPAIEVSLITTSLAMTAEGAGISVLPEHMLPRAHFPNLVAVPLSKPTIVRHVSSVCRRGVSLSPAAERFIAMAQELLHDLPISATAKD